jgi:hypothetical protein
MLKYFRISRPNGELDPHVARGSLLAFGPSSPEWKGGLP